MPAYAKFSVDANTKALWHMDGTVGNAAKKDNAEGTAGLDLVENNVPGSGSGFNGETDGAYTLDGTSDFLSVADANAISYDGSNNLTVEGWFKLGDTNGVQTIMSKWGNGSGAGQEYIVYANGTTLTGVTLGATAKPVTLTIAANTLYYLAFSMDSSKNLSMSVNAGTASTNSHTSTITNTSGELRFGENGGSNRAYLTVCDEWRISDKVRTATEISDYYNGASSSAIKTVNGIAKASVKTVNGLAIASVKTINGLA